VLLNDIGRYEDAQAVFQQANQSVAHPQSRVESEIDKKFAVKHLETADLYFRYRRYDEAIEEYTKAATLDPTALEIRIRRAKAYSRKGFVTRAMHELEQLKNENPSFLPARIQLGLLHYSQGNTLDAELEWESVLKANPNNAEALSYIEMSREAQLRRN
jgi:tetratricopeptide (TPR) repeat protein